MFLTRFSINSARRGSQKLLASPQAMHAAVLSAFDPVVLENASGPGRVLWRVDHDTGRRTQLYIASPIEPDLTHLVEQAGWPTQATWDTRSCKPLHSGLAEGQVWGFRITANPIHHIRTAPGRPTKATAHVTTEQQSEWMRKRGPANGFEIGVDTNGEAQITVTRRHILRFTRDRRTVTIATATFDGVLQVTDPEKLRGALTQGIGKARAYGCGLLTLAPIT